MADRARHKYIRKEVKNGKVRYVYEDAKPSGKRIAYKESSVEYKNGKGLFNTKETTRYGNDTVEVINKRGLISQFTTKMIDKGKKLVDKNYSSQDVYDLNYKSKTITETYKQKDGSTKTRKVTKTSRYSSVAARKKDQNRTKYRSSSHRIY